MTADDVIAALDLRPLPQEGGYFRETYRSKTVHGNRSLITAIYYLITPTNFSNLHRVKSDEMFHFYLGDPVEQVQLFPDGSGQVVILGTDIHNGQHPQMLVSAGVWQGARLAPGGKFALLGTTVAPGFDFADYEHGDATALALQYSHWHDVVLGFG